MKLNTASSVVSFAKKIEDETANFYKDLSQRHAEANGVFLCFAKENIKNAARIDRVYYGAISDLIEGTFSFNMESVDYAVETPFLGDVGYSGALAKAIELEEKIGKFYYDAGQQSKSLMADVSVVFLTMAKLRSNRVIKLRSGLG